MASPLALARAQGPAASTTRTTEAHRQSAADRELSELADDALADRPPDPGSEAKGHAFACLARPLSNRQWRSLPVVAWIRASRLSISHLLRGPTRPRPVRDRRAHGSEGELRSGPEVAKIWYT